MFWSCLAKAVVVALGHLQLSLWEDLLDPPALLLTPALVLMVPVLMFPFPFLLIPVGLATLAVLLCRLLYCEIRVVFPSMPGSLESVHRTRGTVQVLVLVFGPPDARLTVQVFLVIVLVLRMVLRLRDLWAVSDPKVGLSYYP